MFETRKENQRMCFESRDHFTVIQADVKDLFTHQVCSQGLDKGSLSETLTCLSKRQDQDFISPATPVELIKALTPVSTWRDLVFTDLFAYHRFLFF